jgi:hypothetical protein
VPILLAMSFSRRPRRNVGLAAGFRSGLEESIAAQITAAVGSVEYEQEKLRYTKPESSHTYTPDFKLPNGIIVETKGRFVTADRQKHLLIKAQHPQRDIRFVFSNPNARISKTSETTYAAWCEKHGFQYAKKAIPDAWFKERRT